jgi:hypothetical protein
MIYELSYWKIHERHWKEEPQDWNRKFYRLQEKGYQGYYVNAYSPFEYELIKKFIKNSDTFSKRQNTVSEYDKIIGKYYEPCVSFYTKNGDDFEKLMQTIPKRNSYLVFPEMLSFDFISKKDLKKFNYVLIDGNKAVAISFHYDENHKELMTKLTLIKLTT